MKRTRVVCHLTNFSPEYPGSFVDALLCLAQHSRDTVQAQTLCIFPEEAKQRPWLARFKDEGIDYRFVPRVRNVGHQVRALLQGYDPVVFHTHFFLYDLTPLFLKIFYRQFRRSKIIWHYHNPTYAGFPQTVKNVVKLRLLGSYVAHGCIACGDGVYDSLINAGLSRDKLHLIRNGVVSERFAPNEESRISGRVSLGISERQFVFLLLGLDPLRKGVDIFAKAALSVVRSGMSDVLFLIVGRNETRKFFSSLPEYGEIKSVLNVIEPTEDISTLFRSADVLVSASRSEGLAYSVLESMAAEKLVLSSEIPGVRDSYGTAEGVRLFPNEDWEALATLMKEATALPLAARQHLGGLNSLYVKDNYSLENWAKKIIAVYSEVLKREAD